MGTILMQNDLKIGVDTMNLIGCHPIEMGSWMQI